MNTLTFGKLLLITFVFCVNAEKVDDEVVCPAECICETAPLRTAPFVMTWMTSWGEDSLPEVHKNDILNPALMVSSGTAKDANVDVNRNGLHVTCSLHSTTNTSKLLSAIPPKSMVLTLLQAPGCNFTIIDGGQLGNFHSLIGLHIQGYAYKDKKQVSGFTPNKVPEFTAQHAKIGRNSSSMMELTLALAEDALKSLVDLQLIDLQYVKLVASKDIRRLRRYTIDPISSRILLDLPLPSFLEASKGVEDFLLPPYLEQYDYFYDYDRDADTIESNIFPIDSYFAPKMDRSNDIKQALLEENLEQDNALSNYFDSLDDSKLLPYMMFRANFKRKLAPFSTLKSLKYLRIAHGKLEKIGPELLDGLHKLHTLTLEHNYIQVIPEDIFNTVPALRHLSLAHNKIISADFKSLRGLSQLLTIDLDYNEMQIIGPNSFPILQSLKTIRAIGNPIVQIFPDAFHSVNNSENIYLGSSSNSMDIHEDSFRSLPFLDTLELQNVTKAHLKRNLFSGIPEIKHLTIHGLISEINFDAFSKISLLKDLDLSHCALEKLSMDAFLGLYNLKRLDLSYNKLSEIAPGTFDYLTNLKELYMNNNDLTTLPLGIFLPIPAKIIRLEENPWICTCDLLQLRPSITNKVKRSGSVVCRWSDKLATVCKKTRDRFAYDARVAPLCAMPHKLHGNDVYHAALRYLKCNKYHWDPKLLLAKDSTRKLPKYTKRKIAMRKRNRSKPVGDAKTKVGWAPLSDHTPEPALQKDLLYIAETEELEEVEEYLIDNSTKATKSVEISQISPQNDEPKPVKNSKSSYLSKAYIKEQKLLQIAALKMAMKRKDNAIMKKRYKHKMQQKAKLKAFLKNKKRDSYSTNWHLKLN